MQMKKQTEAACVRSKQGVDHVSASSAEWLPKKLLQELVESHVKENDRPL